MRGKRIEEILPAVLVEQVSSYYRQAVASGQVLQYREVFRPKRGSVLLGHGARSRETRTGCSFA